VTYLIIFLLVAAAGIGSLYFHQRRQRAHLDSVDGFRESLLKISSHRIAVPEGDGPESHAPMHDDESPNGRMPLDPARREAARRRLEARRAIRSH
jgi:hypothetical protein